MKNIVIIGNANIKNDHSDFINSADFVIRFNEARNYGGNSGTKIDALCLTNLSTPGRLFAKYKKIIQLPFINDTKEIWFPRPSNYLPFQFWIKPLNRNRFAKADYRKHIISRNNLSNKKIVSFSENIYSNCCEQLEITLDSVEHFPSTGYITIKHVLEKYCTDNYFITILGFSFEGTNCHKWDIEKAKIYELHYMKKINIIYE